MNTAIIKDKDGDIWEPIPANPARWECRTEDAPNLSYPELKLMFGPLGLYGYEGVASVPGLHG